MPHNGPCRHAHVHAHAHDSGRSLGAKSGFPRTSYEINENQQKCPGRPLTTPSVCVCVCLCARVFVCPCVFVRLYGIECDGVFVDVGFVVFCVFVCRCVNVLMC